MDDYRTQSAGNARSITDEMDARVGGAGPAYVNQDRGPATLNRVERSAPTVSDCAEQTNQLNSLLADALDRARNLVDRIGAPYPPSPAEAATKQSGNGPVDYVHQNQQCAMNRVVELVHLLQAIGQRI